MVDLEPVANCDRFIVTGPQRSGTRITAQIVAHELRCAYIDETSFDIHDETKARELLNLEPRVAIQCPALSHICHELADKKTAVLFCIRDISDIKASERRINWRSRSRRRERHKYFTTFPEYFQGHPDVSGFPISAIKYRLWDEVQKPLVPIYLEIPYLELSDHPFFINKRERRWLKWHETG